MRYGFALCSMRLLFLQKVKDGPIDFAWSLPHGDVTAFFDPLKLRMCDGPMEALSQLQGKDEVPFPPDE